MLAEAVLFGVFGLGLETVFTAALDWRKDPKRHLLGYSSLWYLPLYALAPLILQHAGPFLFPLALPVRGLIYMLAFWTLEYPGMLALRLLLGTSPSEESYYKCRWNVHGLIRLDFAPAGFSLGLILEGLFRFIRHI